MTSKRQSCPKCQRPLTECYCHVVVKLASDVKVVILQHHSESRHPFNTARMVDMALEESVTLVGESFQLDHLTTLGLDRDDYYPMLFFPGEASRSVAEHRQSALSNGLKPLLFVPDGTWRKARKILHCSPEIAELPRVELESVGESIYGVRKGSEEGGVSTVEACYYFLSEWQGNSEAYLPLLAPLKWLNKRQSHYKRS